MPRHCLNAAILSLFFAVPAAADGPVVVELFTSQGCSSCPPADAIMHDLAKRDDVIGLALHVDYWDYIGWKDEYADPFHTTRQRIYARQGGRDVIYTPQMVVNGQQDVVGAKRGRLEQLIAAHLEAAPVAQVSATRSGDTVSVQVAPLDLPTGAVYDIRVVQFTPLRHASIRRGELAGRELDYANVVSAWHVGGQWDGAGPQEFQVSLNSDLPAVALVQQAGHGPIIAAVRVD
ncbi:conserved hypothetical protein [Ruegeria lacuscaerulensis ITI-1157]|nr:conserved hypothetical protein [Ruegeria lacuscaerulensis ITI-1157]SHJ09437.1 hypothetical protein SAMN05444404_1410 [Ruegeria lacuscaerulensis ITI-1157]